MQETQVRSPGREEALKKEMAIHSSILAWKIPCTEEPGRLSPWDTKSWTQLRELKNNNNNKIPAILVV